MHVDLSSAERAEISSRISSEYAKLKAAGATDEKMSQELQGLYQKLTLKTPPGDGEAVTPVPTKSVPATPVTPAKAAPVANGRAAAAGGKAAGKGGAGKTPTRRRSFEPAAGISASTTLVGSQSVSLLPVAVADGGGDSTTAETTQAPVSEVPNDKDHWDSVSQLPYCSVCQMAFKSQNLLDRHIKYSDLHERTVKKHEAEALKAASAPAADPESAEIAALNLLQEKQVEGKDFKHLYYGSKFYWRSQDNIDFTFFHHLLLDTIEVVSFSVYKNKELNRVYLNVYIINMKLDQAGLLAKADPFLKTPKERQANQGEVDEKNRTSITTFVLSRLQLDNKANGEQTIVYQAAGADDTKTTPLLTEKPALLVPRPVVHRRNTSTEEVTRKLQDLQADQAALAAATNRAEKIGSYVVNFASNFKLSSQKLSRMSKPRRRWAMAIQRVLQINGVERTKSFLEEVELAKKSGRPIVRRGRSNTHDP